MVDFTKQISPVRAEPLPPAAPIQHKKETSVFEEISEVLGVVEQSATLARDIQSVGVKQDFAEGMSDIQKQEAEFLKQQGEIESNLVSAKDKQIIDSVHGKLLSLERGEMIGTLAPLEAAARRRALMSQSISNHPWLSRDFKAIASTIRGSGSGNARITDSPEQKAMDAKRQRAAENGVTLSSQHQIDVDNANLAQIETTVNIAQAAGTLTFPSARLGIANRASIVSKDIFNQANAILRADPAGLDSTDWTTVINNAKSSVNRRMMEMEVGLAKNKIILSDSDRSRMQSDIDAEFAMADQFIKSKDKVAYLERTRKVINEQGFLTMSEQNPYMAMMVANGAGEQAFDLAFRVWPKFLGQVQRSGTYDQVKILAENLGDPDAIMFTQAVEFNAGQYAKGIYGKIRSGAPSTTRYEDILINGMSGSIIGMDIDPDDPELNAARKMAHERLLSSDALEGEMDHYLKPNVIRQTVKQPSVIKKLDTATKFRTRSSIESVIDETNIVVPNIVRSGRKEISRTNEIKKIANLHYDRRNNRFVLLNVGSDTIEFAEKRRGGTGRTINVKSTASTESLTRILKLKETYGLFDSSKAEWIEQMITIGNKELALPAGSTDE